MNKYEKPIVLENEELAEGVYAASGDETASVGGASQTPADQGNSRTCGSIYIKGNFKQSDWTLYGTGTNIEGRRCEGCPASWGDKCAVSEVNYDGDFRPTWEKEGKGPNDRWNQ